MFSEFLSWLLSFFLRGAGVGESTPSAEAVAAKGEGAAQAGEVTDQATAKAGAAEAQAVVNAPKTQADVVSALDKGTF